MLNLTINPLDRWYLEKKGCCFEFSEKMITLRTSDYKPMIEFIYDELNGQIIVLTKECAYYASEAEIKVTEKELTLVLDQSEIKSTLLNGCKKPILYLKVNNIRRINLSFED